MWEHANSTSSRKDGSSSPNERPMYSLCGVCVVFVCGQVGRGLVREGGVREGGKGWLQQPNERPMYSLCCVCLFVGRV